MNFSKTKKSSAKFALLLIATTILASLPAEVLTGDPNSAENNNGIINLTLKNFNQTVDDSKYVLVMYYANFHKKSKALLKKLEVMKNHVDKSVKFGKIDIIKNQKLAAELEAEIYPGFELYVYGVPIKFKSPKSITKLRKWLKEKVALKVKKAEKLSDLVNENDYEVYYYAKPGTQLSKAMFALTVKYPKMKIYELSEKLTEELVKERKADLDKDKGFLAVHRKHDDLFKVFKDKMENFEIETFILEYEYPNWSNFCDKTIQWFEKEKLPIMFLFYAPGSLDDKSLQIVKDSGTHFKGTVLTVIGDITNATVKKFAEENGFRKFPALTIMEHDTPRRRYLCRKKLKKIVKNTLYRCISRFEQQTLPMFFKSEDPATAPDMTAENIHYIVGEKLNDLIDTRRTVHLVLFYDSKTSEESLANFKAVAQGMSDVKVLSFNIFDLDKNEHEFARSTLQGTLMLFAPNKIRLPHARPEIITSNAIFEFLEDKAPHHIYEVIMLKKNDLGIDL